MKSISKKFGAAAIVGILAVPATLGMINLASADNARAVAPSQVSPGQNIINLTPSASNPEALRIARYLVKDELDNAASLNQQPEIAAQFIDTPALGRGGLLIAQLNSDYSCGRAMGCMTFIFQLADRKKNAWTQVFYNMGDEFRQVQSARDTVRIDMVRKGYVSQWVLTPQGFSLIAPAAATAKP